MRIMIVLLALLLPGLLRAQQSAQYTQYIFNGLVINPAYAGSKGVTNINMLYRSQWTGFEGAPTTQTLGVDGSVLDERVGLGVHLISDRLGVQRELGLYGSTAFRVKLSETSRLSLGLSGGVLQYGVDGDRLDPNNPTVSDPSIPMALGTTFIPDAKAGLFFNTERFYVGLSVANMIAFQNDLVVMPARQYFFTSGLVVDLGENIKFKPSFLVKENLQGPTNVDLNAFLLLKEILWLGGTYRRGVYLFSEPQADNPYYLKNAWAGMAELYVSQKFRVGYSFDLTLTDLRGYPSHELSLGYLFFKKQDSRMLSPRYF